MRQNDIFKKFSLPRWATPIICGLPLGSAGDFAMTFLRATQRSSDPTTADPRRDPIPQIELGIPGTHHQSEVDRTGAVERISWCPDVAIPLDTRYWDRYDNSGSRQTVAEGRSFASVGTYVMTSIRNLCLDRISNLYVKPYMYSFTKSVYFWYMP